MKVHLIPLLLLQLSVGSLAFGVAFRHYSFARNIVGGTCSLRHQQLTLFAATDEASKDETSESDNDSTKEIEANFSSMNKEEKEEIVGNLVADDEWNGLALELSEIIRVAIIEDVKKTTREFTGKDNYKVGDIAKEVDARVKDEVAKMREKEEYELGDLTLALDSLSKDLTCELTGKDNYEFGDLSKELDKRVKNAVEEFCGKPEGSYEFGDLSKEVSKRVANRVAEFTGEEEYEFGAITREIENRRAKWVKDYLGTDDYEFGMITKKFLSDYAGKDAKDYQFGDATKKLLGDLFGGKKKKGVGK